MQKKWNIGWGTISKCNMNCQFCYSKKRRGQSDDVSYDDWIKFIEENQERISSINYGTGENSLSLEWFKLVDYIRRKYPNIRQAVTTNGYLSEAILNKYCKNIFIKAIDEVDVSLDFYNSDKHNEFRGQPKAYQWAIDTLDVCQQYNKVTTIVFLGSKQNITRDNIDGLFEIAKKYSAILRMNMYRPTEGVNDRSKQFIIPCNQLIDAIKYINEKYQIITLNDTLFSTIFTGETVDDPSGNRSIRILADGSITPSTYLIDEKYIVGNIKQRNVLSRLEEDGSLEKIIFKNIPQECNECVYSNTCAGGVMDRRYLWYGDINKKDPYCKQIYKEKSKNLIHIRKTKYISVHDGYLPTMFFKPV